MKIKLAILAATLASSAALAQEQTQPAPGASGSAPNDVFAQLDSDGSSGISAQEAQASPVVTQAFSRADANTDGILTREEFYAAFQVSQPGDSQQQAAPQPQSTTPDSAPPEPQPE
jgi:hypothetical protein